MNKPVLEDVIEKGVVTLFCGSAAVKKSARLGQYYAGPGNQFWPILHQSCFTKHLLTPQKYGQVVNFRIGLTDLAKFEFGNDYEIPSLAYQSDPLLEKIHYYQPRFLALVSKTVAKSFMSDVFGIQALHAESRLMM
ncbi:MAG: mismatch-specific DNA-glycosylase [Gammaproteobacteria bacterium]|nr:mismatch-specific DNA-glycosylase [Gammaproteobacteria bacterium]